MTNLPGNLGPIEATLGSYDVVLQPQVRHLVLANLPVLACKHPSFSWQNISTYLCRFASIIRQAFRWGKIMSTYSPEFTP
jgi:hypothetical protein